MTLPIERTNAILNTEQFLLELLDPKKTPRIPKEIRRRAGRLLKHYPTHYDMENIHERLEPYIDKPVVPRLFQSFDRGN